MCASQFGKVQTDKKQTYGQREGTLSWADPLLNEDPSPQRFQKEIYFFIKGKGEMELINTNGERTVEQIQDGDVVLIPDGHFHRVHNTGDYGLYFVCVFDGKRNH